MKPTNRPSASTPAGSSVALPATPPGGAVRPGEAIPFGQATKAWFLISLQTFGGPAGQIAVMQRTLVDEKRWLGQRRFLHALNYCMLLPGPEAQQLAIYTGWLLNGLRGGLVAGTLFVLPGMVALLGLSALYVGFGDTTVISGLFLGLAPAVIAIVVQAVIRVSRRALTHPALVVLAVVAFLALSLFAVPFPAVVLGAGLIRWGMSRIRPTAPAKSTKVTASDDRAAPLISDDQLHQDLPSARRTLTILGIGLAAWAAPIVAVGLAVGWGSIFVDQGLFFSGAALVTFGGAYAVLAYVAQQAVNVYGWLLPGEMVRGLALAESTPGPLIMVVQFVAFVGAYRNPGDLNPWTAAIIAALLTTWVTFVPCFLFVLLGAPYIEKLRSNQALSAALTGITAAVVGVIANLATFFALHTLFAGTRTASWGILHVELPHMSTLQWPALAITAVACALIFAAKWSVLRTLGACAVLGMVCQLLIVR
ncbi:MAG TPA: chromate efflux transporter [Propionibacteriaceae bacterium]